ncbi:tyrosine-protein kinase-like otk [Contarinia nasturtii]|uniref:tyrosine-protein kinase-like otk n=1 Tax=Contarinia nasturtii TaxID=265458 RepID=UPI0012D458FE|nr:tyrosine-protein kinase-like otk [Contarinia nasturtii]XP_031627855.1 tyrosine-protein kinase-like otk [Contarinia nasturtii]XP_031627863.1 tyrosine-protein kinase-like otk [Contarinia nasturtii]XP_031627872.1 tyrosine-protein kinase-like otk [Contarinia nasturtii]XP_031627881.1 tyrosine-protein kinase-like otk [Contarinia nasturtii]
MISNEKTYLFLLAFMIFSSASLYAIDDGFDTGTKVVVQTVEAIESEYIVLSCGRTTKMSVNNNDVKWFFNDILVANQSKRKIEINGDLHINYVQRMDSGYYRCVWSQAGEHNRRTEITKIIKLDTIWLTAAEVMYTSSSLDGHKLSSSLSSAIILKCHVNANPIDEVRWFKNGKPVNSIGPLVIRHPTQNNNGNYKCMARNKIGMVVSEPYRLEIHANNAHNAIHYGVSCEPKITRRNTTNSNQYEKSLLCRYKRGGRLHRKRSASEGGGSQIASSTSKRKKISIAEDNSATINCDVSRLDRKGNQVSVRWRKDGKVLRQASLNEQSLSHTNTMETPLLSRVNMDSKNGSITIANTIPSDAGIYECTILRNGNAVQSVQTTELNIIEKLKFTPPPTSKGLEIGSVAKIHCKAQGTPTPQIQWTKDSTNNLPDSVEDINGTLIFKNVSESNRGNYTCRAASNQGEISATVIVTPVIAPKFLVKPQGAIQVNEMGSVMIHCSAIGDPKPKIQWDKDFDYLNISNSDASRLNVLENGTLYFTEVHLEDEGLYGCTIGSSAGLKREEAHLSVRPSEEQIADDGQEGSFFVVRAVLITVTVVFSYIILVVGLMFWCRVKRKARKNRMQLIAKENVDTLSRNDTKPTEPNDENEPCLAERNHKKTEKGWNGTSNGVGGHNDATKTDTSNANNTKQPSKSSLEQITIPRGILFDLTQIGRGEFGTIHTAKVKFCDLKQHLDKETVATLTVENEREHQKSNGTIENADEIKQVPEHTDDTVNYALIKALNKVKDENVCIEFRRQLDLFRAVSHNNVVKLFGLCRDKNPHYLVLEHTDLGDLKEFLSARVDQLSDLTSKNGIVPKINNADKCKIATIKLPQLLLIAQQIARGMDAIYRARYIHRDLAARNCVITSDLTVKVSYPANIKDKYAREYYKLKSSMVPLRWMAPECIEDDDNTIKSDVYSFGVLILELFTFCSELPLAQVSDDDYFKQLQTNSIERKLPDFLPDDLSNTLSSCWKTNQKERPSFSTLNTSISKYLQQIDANDQAHT